MRRSRAMVLDEVWRGLDGVGALSGPPGGPLRRTVKLILDPLVIRPVQHPLCAPTVLDADGVALLTALVHAQSDTLRACASWFAVLKQTRRALRITEGNAQDLYFQRCFELATVHGAPDGERGREIATATLREIHESTGGRTTAALKSYVTEPDRAVELAELLMLAWSRRPVAAYDPRDRAEELIELLDACTLAREGDPADAGPLFDDVVEDGAGTHRGIALWQGADANELGLTRHAAPQQPQLGASAATAKLGLPFDRTVYERVFTVLQGSTDRTELPDIPELVSREISRSCSPWGLLDESLRVAAAAGSELALGLSPLGEGDSVTPRVTADLGGHTADAEVVQVGDAPAADTSPSTTRMGDAPAAGLGLSARHRSANPADTDDARVGDTSDAEAGTSTRCGSADTAGAQATRIGDVSASGVDQSVRGRSADTADAEATPLSDASAGAGPAARRRSVVVSSAPVGSADDGTPGGWRVSRAHAVVNARWRREGYVLQARRFAVHGVEGGGPLGVVAAELRRPWRPYLRRLWVRLHGRDVREMPVCEAGELWDLLDGVARSVMLDHRARVKQVLTAEAAAVPDARAS
ncbi:hypothetical protein ACFXK0_26145 [Nocardia sp. NPDC059177]|uniref:hypothetical protein n=1 Tax=Nocardia sp. NPDC059177 TaxID=3346759 RepID=UPI0036B05198